MNDSDFIINVALTGIVPKKNLTPYVPVNCTEIVEEVAECLELGVQMFHIHARDEAENHTGDPEIYGRIIEHIRKLPNGRDAILCVTTSGRQNSDFLSRSRVLDLDGDMKPDMASLTLSSLNFQNAASVNSPDTIRALANKMLNKGIKPELEVFDLGMANFANVLIKEGLITDVPYINLLLGNLFSAQPTLHEVSAIKMAMPANSVICLAGLGRYQMKSNLLGLVFFDGVRVGIEDNIWFDKNRKVLAKNSDFVRRILDISEIIERSIISREVLKKVLRIL